MPNGTANCILAVCCDPESEQRRDAFAKDIVKGTGLNEDVAKRAASYVIANFDLAPKGQLQPFIDTIAKLARENPH